MIQYIDINLIKPNPHNPRKIKDEQLETLVQSIKDFPEMLELRPLVLNEDNVVLGGNQRLKACKKAGLVKVPVIMADQLTEDQQREFILKDNVSAGDWDWKLLKTDWDQETLSAWGVDIPEKKYQDKNVELKLKPILHKKGDFYYISLFRARGEEGSNLEDFKKDPNNAERVAFMTADFLQTMYQHPEGVVIVTTPRRSHTKKNGFHFASAVCEAISEITGIPFLDEVFTAKDNNKIEPQITLEKEIQEANVILIDDIITTGSTLTACRSLIQEKNILILPLINNN